MALCCAECFTDPHLKKWVETEGTVDGSSVCDYCGSSGRLLDVGQLTPVFRKLVDHLYIPTSELVDSAHLDHLEVGAELDQLVDDDLEVFSMKVIDLNARRRLLFDILDDGHDPHSDELYNGGSLWCSSESQPYIWSVSDYWSPLSRAIMRLGPGLLPGTAFKGNESEKEAYNVIQQELMQLPWSLGPTDLLWRARRGSGYTGKDLGAPPLANARAGRANQKGQVVLYVAGDRDTALQETRPALGERISVGRFRVSRQLKICDLIPHFETGSPFEHFDRFVEGQRRNELRGTLGKALAQRVDGDPGNDYLPTQFLCQMVRDMGFDGVAYESTQHPHVPTGFMAPKRDEFYINYVLFDPSGATQEGLTEEYEVRSTGDFVRVHP